MLLTCLSPVLNPCAPFFIPARENDAANNHIKWQDEDMVAVIGDVKDYNLTVTAAARKHNVLRKTPDNRIKSKVVNGMHLRVSTALTAEKSVLVVYIVHMAQRGYPLTHTLTKAFAMGIAVRSGKE